jgi:CheY-like chemotaxis protein
MARILCVDDELPVVNLTCVILEGAGHTVTTATSAREAVEKIQNHAYDAVLTGWHLGDATGGAVVEAAKRRDSSTPVVVVTAYLLPAFNVAEPFADIYLEKPVDPEELIIIVNELLKNAGIGAYG